MTLPDFDFNAIAFSEVRKKHLGSDGFFAAKDPSLPLMFVIADATFWNMEIFFRIDPSPYDGRFTVDAEAATKSGTGVRAIVNGQRFDYPGWGTDKTWYDQCISGHTVKPGTEWQWAAAKMYHFGRWAGRTHASYRAGQGQPELPTYVPGDPLVILPMFTEAAGYLLPIIERGHAFGDGNWDSKGRPTELNQHLVDAILTRGAGIGRPIYGVHRATNLVFFLVHRHKKGLTTPELIELLMDQGVDDAMLGDGSDSTALIVDGVTEEKPDKFKNRYISIGMQLRNVPTAHTTSGTTTFDPLPSAGYPGEKVSGPTAHLQWSGGTISLHIANFGGPVTAPGVPPLPVTLQLAPGSGNNTAWEVTLQDGSANVKATIAVKVNDTTKAMTVQGTIMFNATTATPTTGTIRWGVS